MDDDEILAGVMRAVLEAYRDAAATIRLSRWEFSVCRLVLLFLMTYFVNCSNV